MDQIAHSQKIVPAAALAIEERGQETWFVLSGSWTVAQIKDVDGTLRSLATPKGRNAVIDLSHLEGFDTAGAWLIFRTQKALEARAVKVRIDGANEQQTRLFETVTATEHAHSLPAPRAGMITLVFARIGEGLVIFVSAVAALAGFLGLMLSVLGRTIVHPHKLRAIPLVHHVEQAGYDAVAIIALINFLVGAVIAYQGAAQLRMFGAEIFAVDLTSISILREIGILLTAIMVAGRSGSAFAAEIGAMKVREEVDAMRTLALDPMEMLAIPRVLALVIALPLLTFVADITGLLGGALVCWGTLGIAPANFIVRLNEVTDITNFWVGMFKAPFFGFFIGLIGCHEGFRVEGSAESVGTHTTMAVVEAIFVVIILDALFSIFFFEVGW